MLVYPGPCVTGIASVLAKNVRSQNGYRRFAFKRKEGHMGAGVRQYAIVRGRQETYYKEFQELIEYMNVQSMLLGRDHIWPNRIWPTPHLAKPNLANTTFGQL